MEFFKVAILKSVVFLFLGIIVVLLLAVVGSVLDYFFLGVK